MGGREILYYAAYVRLLFEDASRSNGTALLFHVPGNGNYDHLRFLHETQYKSGALCPSIEIFDTGIAFFAGLMIVPAVFAFSGGNTDALNAGPGLMFITLPKVFASMPFGSVLGTAFFILVFFAAVTSSISLMETIVSILMDYFHWERKKTAIIVLVYCLLMGIPSSLRFGVWDFIQPLGMSILDAWDFISNSILMPIVALLTCFFVGFVIKPKTIIDEANAEGAKFKSVTLFTVVIKWVAPVILIAILISSVLNAAGIYTL